MEECIMDEVLIKKSELKYILNGQLNVASLLITSAIMSLLQVMIRSSTDISDDVKIVMIISTTIGAILCVLQAAMIWIKSANIMDRATGGRP
jgi:hypothetical protein